MSQNNRKENIDLSTLRIDRERKPADRPGRGWWKYGVILAVIAVVVIAYLYVRESVVPTTKIRAATVTVLAGPEAAAQLVATGYVVAQRKAEVASKGTGRLVYLGFEEGDLVSEGEVIAQLDNDDVKASLEVSQANLMRAEVDSLERGRNYRRQLGLFESGAITDAELQAVETQYNMSVADVAAAAAAVRVAAVALDNTYIRAPFDGTILTKNADVGEIVAPFASSASSKGSVVTLADMKSLEVEADVSESNIYKVLLDQPCVIVLDAYPDFRYDGFVKKIVPTADRARATVLTKVAFSNIDEKVYPEMSARVTFFSDAGSGRESANSRTLVVARDAVTSRDGRSVVFVVREKRVTAVAVQTGRELDAQVEILNGLSQGDRVVLLPPGRMADGQKVEVVP